MGFFFDPAENVEVSGIWFEDDRGAVCLFMVNEGIDQVALKRGLLRLKKHLLNRVALFFLGQKVSDVLNQFAFDFCQVREDVRALRVHIHQVSHAFGNNRFRHLRDKLFHLGRHLLANRVDLAHGCFQALADNLHLRFHLFLLFGGQAGKRFVGNRFARHQRNNLVALRGSVEGQAFFTGRFSKFGKDRPFLQLVFFIHGGLLLLEGVIFIRSGQPDL